ncbi:Piwi-domain-containing protein [Xylariaceae sp. AK1471]|nr:Piwi-domain-containing protein [Xylariaceae sp. AK1471]
MATWRGPGSRGRGGSRGAPSYSGRGGGPSRDFAAPQVFSSPRGIPIPDQRVTEAENSLLASGASVDLGRLRLQESFPIRPAYGASGTSVILWANYFALTPSPQLVLYRYDLAVKPTATGKKLAQIIRLFLQSPALMPLREDIVTDFKSTLISRQKLEDQNIEIQYRAENEDVPRDGAPQYTIRLQFTNVLPVAELIEYLTSTNLSAHYDQKLPMIQAFNIFLNQHAKSSGNLATIGASKTFPLDETSDTWDLTNCLTAIRGFFASVRAGTARVLVNVNISHGAFYQAGPLDEFILCFGSHKSLFKLEAFLKRLRVKSNHLKERKNKSGQVVVKAKTIFGLATKNDGHGLAHPPRIQGFGSGPKNVEFWLDEHPSKEESSSASSKKKKRSKGPQLQGKPSSASGRYVSVYDFFATTHGIRISNPNLPVVNVGNRENPSYLPPQVCYVLAGQPANHKLNQMQTQKMIQFAVRRPAENATSIVTKGRQTAGLSPDTNPQLTRFGITVSSDLITVQGRLLAEPKVVYKQNKQAQMMTGGWNMVPRNSPGLKFRTGAVLQKWSCLYIDMPPTEYPNAQKFTSETLNSLVAQFLFVLRDTGIEASPPLPSQRVQLNDTDDPALESCIARAASSLQMLFVILPASPIPLYNRLKQLADVKYGIHTVCSVGSKIAKPQGQDQYLRNEALKVNLKLGGENHMVEPRNLGIITEDKTMIVGIDVTHPSPGSSSAAPSVAAMVSSLNSRLGQWPGILSIQSESRQEMVSDLKDMLKSRLRLWRERGKHSAYPENILVYRDGVSEGQYSQVLEKELPHLRAACKEVYPALDQSKGLPRMTVIVVGKRHHTRFYVTKEADADRSGNPKPGTVIDRGVTEARSWDFFLQAHAAIKGTARPAHYFVVLDEIFRQRLAKVPGKNVADELQQLTQSMCYVFGRATKAVSYCTPAYYADILCERARCYLYHVFDTPSHSVAPSVTSSSHPGAGPSQEDLNIHVRLKDSMFYI